jgi:hypothetical protein
VPHGTDTPGASEYRGSGDRLVADRIGPLRGRDAAGRMVWEPRRERPQVRRDPRTGAASVARHECQRVVLGGGRGEGRRRGLHPRIALSWLSQATRMVDLRSPLVRPAIARVGEPTADARRPNCRTNSNRRRDLSTVGRSLFLLHRFPCELLLQFASRFDRFQKAGGPKPASPLCLQVNICNTLCRERDEGQFVAFISHVFNPPNRKRSGKSR